MRTIVVHNLYHLAFEGMDAQAPDECYEALSKLADLANASFGEMPPPEILTFEGR